jgi:hypothetical protein
MTSPRCKWSRQDIRDARRVSLPDLLPRLGLALRETGGGNFRLLDHPGLIVKDCYWRWPERDMQGNTIDLLVHVLGRTFDQAMTAILQR